MNQVTIDNETYDLDSLSDEARQELLNVQVVNQEIQRLQTQLAIASTAKNAYARALKAALPPKLTGDTIKF